MARNGVHCTIVDENYFKTGEYVIVIQSFSYTFHVMSEVYTSGENFQFIALLITIRNNIIPM